MPISRDTVLHMGDTVVMDVPDGRELAWLESGDAKGPAVFVFHGTPGSRLEVSCDQGPIISSGVRFIAVDRPGYGHSTFQRGRRLADWASDVTCLADHLKIDGFYVIGVSGGGPHAAACARFISDRVLGAGIVSGVGPLADTGAEEGMMGFNRAVIRLARRSQYAVYPLFALSASVFRRWPELAPASRFRSAAELGHRDTEPSIGEIGLYRHLSTVALNQCPSCGTRFCPVRQ
jgi:pimeloyl-ACP methyl ester carboxylesterase